MTGLRIFAFGGRPVRTAGTAARFWAKVDKNGPIPSHRPDLGPCWVWTASRTDRGYGRVRLAGREHGAHRIAWLLTHGSWPEFNACHACDNPSCVRAAHLFDGDQGANMRDASAKGRVMSGAEMSARTAGVLNGNARLSEEDVCAIRESADSSYAIAERFGISRTHVRRIQLGRARMDSAFRNAPLQLSLLTPVRRLPAKKRSA